MQYILWFRLRLLPSFKKKTEINPHEPPASGALGTIMGILSVRRCIPSGTTNRGLTLQLIMPYQGCYWMIGRYNHHQKSYTEEVD